MPMLDLDKGQSALIDNPICSTLYDHDPEGVCVSGQHPNEPKVSSLAAINSSSFWPALLELDEGEPETKIYIPTL